MPVLSSVSRFKTQALSAAFPAKLAPAMRWMRLLENAQKPPENRRHARSATNQQLEKAVRGARCLLCATAARPEVTRSFNKARIFPKKGSCHARSQPEALQ